MAMSATFPFTIMEAALGRLLVVETITVDATPGSIAIQPIPNDSLTAYTDAKFRL